MSKTMTNGIQSVKSAVAVRGVCQSINCLEVYQNIMLLTNVIAPDHKTDKD